MTIHDVSPIRHPIALRILHWLMAILSIVMLMIGVAMVSTAGSAYSALLALHRPIGLGLLTLVIVRLFLRAMTESPQVTSGLPRWHMWAATSTHILLYVAMFGLPLVGWAMLAAGGYPVYLTKALVLPPIGPLDLGRYGLLRTVHAWGAFAFLGLILVHITAALAHALIRRDHVLQAMSFGQGRRSRSTKERITTAP